MQRVDHPDPAAANAQALDDLQNGATGLVLVFAGSVSANGFGLDPSPATLARALDGVDLDRRGDRSQSRRRRRGTSSAISPRWSKAAASRRQRSICAPASIRSAASPLPAAGRGPGTSWRHHFAAMVGELAGDGFRGPFAVADGRIIHNAGGSEAQELAFALASAVAYLRALEASGMALEAARDAIYFRLSADADQFLTMAKFRAARKLWARVEAACGLTPKPLMIAAETAWRMMTQRDPYVNMLRTTIAVAAAGLGGADSITVLPHTAPLGLPDAFARRVARNTQLVLLEESNLARVADPAAGSGALEAMTQELCTAAWSSVPRDRTGRRRLGGAGNRPHSAMPRRCAPNANGDRPPHRHSHRHQRISKHQRDFARSARCGAGGACRKTTAAVIRRGAAAHPACRAVRTAARRRPTKSWRKPAHGRKSSWRRSASLPTSMPAPTSPRTFSRPAASKRSAATKAPSPLAGSLQGIGRRARLPVRIRQDLRKRGRSRRRSAQDSRCAAHLSGRSARPAKEAALRAAGVQTFIHDGCDVAGDTASRLRYS